MLANFSILSDSLLFKYFSLDVYFKENLDSGVLIKLCQEVGNHEYIILRNFNGRNMSGFEVKEGGLREQPQPPTLGRGKRKKPRSDHK